MSKEAWSRWGSDDERGALNLIGAEQVRLAAKLVVTGEVLSLAQPLSGHTPVPSHRGPLMHLMNRDGGDYAAGARSPGGFQFAEDTLVMPVHCGTHIDALCHAWCDDHLYNGFPSSTIRSTTGATRCGAEKMGPIVGRGVLFDVARHRGHPLAKGESIDADELQAIARNNRIELRPGDVVLVRTGWQETTGHSAATFYDGEPGINVSAALWLAQNGVAVVGSDNFAVEAIPFPSETVFPVHQRLIRDFGIPLLEGLILEPLAQTGRIEFLFSAAPLPIVGGTGSPLAPIAVL